jgi:hypothetical protein
MPPVIRPPVATPRGWATEGIEGCGANGTSSGDCRGATLGPRARGSEASPEHRPHPQEPAAKDAADELSGTHRHAE